MFFLRNDHEVKHVVFIACELDHARHTASSQIAANPERFWLHDITLH